MTIFPPRPPSFTCAICGEFRDWSQGYGFRWHRAAEFDIPPICRCCEKTWGMEAFCELLWNNAFQAGWREANRAKEPRHA